MCFKSLLNLLSIAPLLSSVPPKSKMRAGIAQPATISTQPVSTMPNEVQSTEEKIGRKLSVLAEFMKRRPANAPPYRVIAIDGIDRIAVHTLIANLRSHIPEGLHYTVRVFRINPFMTYNNQPTEIPDFTHRVRYWDSVWRKVLDENLPSTISTQLPVASNIPVVCIVPMSPLMVTSQALHPTMDPHDSWRALSTHWGRSFRPDVTINIQDIANTRNRPEVLQFQIDDMNALVVNKKGNTGLNITSEQMERLLFEVKEWIR